MDREATRASLTLFELLRAAQDAAHNDGEAVAALHHLLDAEPEDACSPSAL